MTPSLHHAVSRPAVAIGLSLLVALPWLAEALGQGFYIGFATRLLIFALAASSLNLILGFGGMVSLGHAAYFGFGAYLVAILAQHQLDSMLLVLPAALLAGGVLAALIGVVALRTQGVHFIMITLAFAQMLFYVMSSLKAYGADDGMALGQRSTLPGVDLGVDRHYYWLVLVVTVLAMGAMLRVINSRFGRVLQAVRDNPVRMEAIGFPVFRYRLVGFSMAGALACLAGALLANQSLLVSPHLMHWTQSGSLMVMVILGGIGYFWGGALGAVVMLCLEEVLSAYTTYWQLALGVLLLAAVMAFPGGLMSLWRKDSGQSS